MYNTLCRRRNVTLFCYTVSLAHGWREILTRCATQLVFGRHMARGYSRHMARVVLFC